MVAGTLPLSPSIPKLSPSPSSETLKGALKHLNLAFFSSTAKSLRALKTTRGRGSALGARMASETALRTPFLLDFETSVFKKDAISLADRDEVFFWCNACRIVIIIHFLCLLIWKMFVVHCERRKGFV